MIPGHFGFKKGFSQNLKDFPKANLPKAKIYYSNQDWFFFVQGKE